ncbi:MAG: hypothetical protein GY696_20000 [Gammaproteobacteria bacterium]|nr:hypothetical protein [Gammaproteobacteria bacterium]
MGPGGTEDEVGDLGVLTPLCSFVSVPLSDVSALVVPSDAAEYLAEVLFVFWAAEHDVLVSVLLSDVSALVVPSDGDEYLAGVLFVFWAAENDVLLSVLRGFPIKKTIQPALDTHVLSFRTHE